MSNKFHDEMVGADIHVIHSFTYVDAAARTGATGLTINDEGKVARQTDDESFWVLTDHTGPTWKPLSGVGTDEKVKNAATDTTSDFLYNKVAVSGIATKSTLNQGGNEQLQVHVPNTNTDQAAKVSNNDTTAGFLKDKVVSGTGISVTEVNDGGNETLQIATTGGPSSDEKVKVSANDTTAKYLLEKLAAGSNITITENNDGGDETITIAASTGGGGLGGNHFWRWAPTKNDDILEIEGGGGWPVDKNAPAGKDPVDSAIYVYQFDDDQDEGVGSPIYIPALVTQVTLRIRGRARTDPAGLRAVFFDMYWKEIPDAGPAGAWSAAHDWHSMVSMSDDDWHYWEATKTLASQSINADTMYLFELVRHGDHAGDDLSGDFLMAAFEVEFT